MSWSYNEKPKFKKVEGKLKVDWDFYISLLYKQAPSKTLAMDSFVNWLYAHLKTKHPKAIVKMDKIGNIYFTKGISDIYPCMISHTDTAQKYHDAPIIFNTGNWVFAVDDNTGEQIGVGMDDKNGIYISLEMISKFDNIKAFFPVNEEIGGIGSNNANLLFFKDCSILIQPDRRSYTTDLITNTNGIEICNKEFTKLIKKQMLKYDYTENTGTYTDVGILKRNQEITCPAFNFSCGYFDEHQDSEVTNCIALENALNFCYEIIKNQGAIKHAHISKIIEIKPITNRNYYDRYNNLEHFSSETEEVEENQFYEFNVYHECPHFNFNNRDGDTEWWVEECLDQDRCPYCEANLEIQEDESYICKSCESVWDIKENSVFI